jgi:phosphatidylethanolamine-binding protein (PEBP) family uncharacterized protein
VISAHRKQAHLICVAVATQPKLALPSGMVSKSETYMFVMLDLDIPPANGSTKRRTLLHCMNTGFKTTGQQLSGAATLLATSEQGPAQYIPPGPPPTDTIAHRYVQLLFQQPAGLSISAADFADTNNRFNFDVPSFMSKNGVSAPVAANFFKVDGRASASATGAATGTGAMPSSTLTTFQGTAGQMDLPYGLAGLLGGMALFAM